MKTSLTLSLICTGLITTTVIAEDKCTIAYQVQNYQESAACFVAQLKKERTHHNLKGAGFSYTNMGRAKEALPYLKEAENKAQTLTDKKAVYSFLGIAYHYTGDYAQALSYGMKFLDVSLKLGDREEIGKAYTNLGEYYRQQKQPQKALEYYEKALEYQDEAKSSATYGNMAIVYHDLKDFEQAEKMHKKSIDIDQKTGDYNSLGQHKKALGGFYFAQNRYLEARVILDEALVISHNTGQLSSEAHAFTLLSIIDYREGSIVRAKEKAAEGLRLAKQSGNAIVLNNATSAWNIVNGK